MQDDFKEAYALALAKYSKEEWALLSTRDQTRVIYEELRAGDNRRRKKPGEPAVEDPVPDTSLAEVQDRYEAEIQGKE